MRSKLGKAVRQRFRKQLAARFPGFEQDREAVTPPGWPVFGLKAAPELMFYIVLAPYRNTDQFTIEAAWSCNGRFPASSTPLNPWDYIDASMHHDGPCRNEFCFRLPRLWQPREYSWDLVPQLSFEEHMRRMEELPLMELLAEPPIEEALAKVAPMVDDAIEKIDHYLLPYFDEVAQNLGYSIKVSELAKRRGK